MKVSGRHTESAQGKVTVEVVAPVSVVGVAAGEAGEIISSGVIGTYLGLPTVAEMMDDPRETAVTPDRELIVLWISINTEMVR